MKKKTFDCIEMKNAIQRKLMAEFDARRSEFESYADFIARTSEQDQTIRAFWSRVAKASGEESPSLGSGKPTGRG
ncbi:MAG: hypothetical protein K1X53_13770 [Candidatus Sumerlaeaceae bacterium]|nr:hypothetical protein [Candidatus Sumerlaeaceae bacterium]